MGSIEGRDEKSESVSVLVQLTYFVAETLYFGGF